MNIFTAHCWKDKNENEKEAENDPYKKLFLFNEK